MIHLEVSLRLLPNFGTASGSLMFRHMSQVVERKLFWRKVMIRVQYVWAGGTGARTLQCQTHVAYLPAPARTEGLQATNYGAGHTCRVL